MEQIDVDVIVVQLHPREDARDVSCRLRLCAPQAVLIALTSVVRVARTPVLETELLLPVLPDSLVEIISALNPASALIAGPLRPGRRAAGNGHGAHRLGVLPNT